MLVIVVLILFFCFIKTVQNDQKYKYSMVSVVGSSRLLEGLKPYLYFFKIEWPAPQKQVFYFYKQKK